MKRYAVAYGLGIVPWERYPAAAAGSIAALLDRELVGRPSPPGRALDLGCGRGYYTVELAGRGWQAVGIDYVPQAIEAAKRSAVPGTGFVAGDVTDLPSLGLGTFDFFLDVGCFQGLNREQQRGEARGVTALANPGATLLMLAFQPTGFGPLAGGVSQGAVEEAFQGWQLLAVEAADTAGLGWPMNRTSPQWYRLGRVAAAA